MTLRPALLLSGPTASGKSALALALAERFGGTVLNADSMQVYRELHVLTARPSAEEAARVPHRLYGIRPASMAGNAAWWRGEAKAAMEEAWGQGRLPILAGGTGLYLATLVEGIAAVPPVPESAREEAAAILARMEPGGAHAELARLDPATAAKLRPSDPQRIERALGVVLATGRGLSAWQEDGREGAVDADYAAITLWPDRAALRTRIEARFGAMLEQGALEEVRGLVALGLDPALPAMRAHGVPELARVLEGRMTLEEARARGVANTVAYAKRQATWLRHRKLVPAMRELQICPDMTGSAQFSKSSLEETFAFVTDALLTPGGGDRYAERRSVTGGGR